MEKHTHAHQRCNKVKTWTDKAEDYAMYMWLHFAFKFLRSVDQRLPPLMN